MYGDGPWLPWLLEKQRPDRAVLRPRGRFCACNSGLAGQWGCCLATHHL